MPSRAAIAIVMSAVCAAPAGAAGPLPEAIPATVIRVIDGDTIEVIAHVWIGLRLTVKVRLAGIDTSELRSPCAEARAKAEAALELARRLTNEGPVVLRRIAPGKFSGRVVAEGITADGENLAQALLNAGLARRYDGGNRRGWCGE